ncbi:hypothetical protein RND71_037074 [Anisodus tanguticus]|uniref:Indole-3-acetate O-methyltransferase 1 n=1 Tax=Anisodus tanguticus TaxID=243964 RepID=A0AAE1R2D8_9SOLA|nr:hypothetical protein RND71_037074 [Anisodus tanguticus]
MATLGDNKDNVVVSNVKLERMLSMKGGKGEASYVNNSQAQGQHARSMLHLLKETLDGVQLSPMADDVPFVMVDLGCSCGRNTVYIIDVIVEHMSKRYEAMGQQPPEFSAFFSDLPSNDFNTLFQLLPPLANNGCGSMEECLASNSHRAYFAAGVPGSFYRRLFPARSIDVPDVVLDKRSVAYNKGRIYIHGANEITANAYKKQFQTDLAGFLGARSKEMKRGGSMFLGLITSEKRDDFNIPVYAPSIQDFKEVVEANGSFTINKLQVFRGGSPLVVNHPDDAAEVGRALAVSCRSVSSVLVDAHIGEQLSDELFARVERRASRHAKEVIEKLQFFHIVACLSLV